MSAFSILQKFHAESADLNTIMDEWMAVSKAKGWPTTEEGLRRYLARLEENGGNIPRRQIKVAPTQTIIPPAFTQWWENHPEAGFVNGSWTITPLNAWRCARYREQWEQPNKEAA